MPGYPIGADVAEGLFLGLNTDLQPGVLPEGCSPDNQDVIYTPGAVLSRPCLHKLYTSVGNATITYVKTYVQPDGTPLTLLLDSNGVLYKEDVLNNPGVLTSIGNVTPGSYCISITQNGKEYMAFSDGIHGTDIPRQFDGTNFDRVSQDGPGAGPTSVGDLNASATIAGANGIAPVFTTVNVASGLENGNTVTLVTATAHGYFPGEVISIVGVGAGYNGVIQVVTVPDATSFTYVSGSAGLAPVGAAGTARAVTVVVTTTTPHGLIGGDIIKIAGNSAAIYNNDTAGNPPTWTVQTAPTPTTFFLVPIADPTVGNNGTVSVGGQISVGSHSAVCMFLTRSGYLTRPSPVVSWLASGGKQVQMTLPIGPSNVVARVVAFAGAGGSSYFWIPVPATGARATIINDNTTTTATFDFADNTLFAATAIDINGNNLFRLITLGPCLGVFGFADRTWWWAEVNKVQAFINMGFEGGFASGAPTVPLGWTIATSGGALVTNPVNFGEAWQITGDGTAALKGELQQTAFQDSLGIAIIKPNTNYQFRCWAKASANLLAGSLIATLSSVSTGFTSTATIPVNTITTTGKFFSANFSLVMPAVIPSDFLFSVFVQNTPNLSTVTIDEMMGIFKDQPYRENDFRVSYPRNPESFDGVSGDLGPSSDPNPIRCCGIIRNTMYILTADRLHSTRNNGQEPSTWDVPQIADECGALSARGIDGGSSWLTWPSDQGLLICEGGAPDKISQEIQPDWDSINTANQHRIWLVNDQLTKRIYLGLPTGTNVGPNLIYPLDYRELDSEQEIASHGSIHVTFTGRMSASELSRKWTRWNLSIHCAAIIRRAGNADAFVVGAGNALAPGSGTGFGNLYYLDPAKLTDDDYGRMSPYYVSYGFVNHDQEQQLQVGGHRKLYTYISFFISGTGTLSVVPYADVLTNPWPAGPQITLSQVQANDIGYGMNVEANRAFIKFLPSPLGGTTDVQFKLTQLVLDVEKHPVSPVR